MTPASSPSPNTHSERGVFLAGVALAIGLVLAVLVGVWGLQQVRGADETIVVTGSARRRITSDRVVWRAGVSYQAPQLSDAYRALTQSVPKVRAYVVSKGVPEDQITISSIQSTTLTAKGPNGEDTGRVSGYSLRQQVEVRSGDVARVATLAREATELIDQGILLESNAPEYYYTKLDDLKVQMLAEAARNAKTRAEQIASSVGSRIGGVRSARMGVLQITAADSTEVSNEGVNDTSSLEKDITSVVSVTFSIR